MFPLKADNPPGRAPVATLALIVVTVVVFLLEGGLGGTSETVLVHFGLIPHELWHGGVHCALNGLGDHVICSDKAAYFGDRQPITSLTLPLALVTHLDLVHLFFNMLFLWLFGPGVEVALGRVRFLALYLACGLGGLVLQALVHPGSIEPVVGASGAVIGIIAAHLVVRPAGKIMVVSAVPLLVGVIAVPVVVMLGVWIVQLVVIGAIDPGSGVNGTAWWTHVGGFAIGLAGALALRRGTAAGRGVDAGTGRPLSPAGI